MAGPLLTIRRECLTCMGCARQDRGGYIETCPSREVCALWPYRLGKRPATTDHRPLRAIHTHCIECVGSAIEARRCTGEMVGGSTCVLHPYRLGTNPRRAGIGMAGGNPSLTGGQGPTNGRSGGVACSAPAQARKEGK